MTAHARGEDRGECPRRDDAASVLHVPRRWRTPGRIGRQSAGVSACLVVVASLAAAVASAQGYGSGAVVVASRPVGSVDRAAFSGGSGFDSVLIEDSSTAVGDGAAEGVVIDQSPTLVSPYREPTWQDADTGGAAAGEQAFSSWMPTGTHLEQAWNSCTTAFQSMAPPACSQCGRGPAACCLAGCCGPRWCAQVDSLVLWQGNIQGAPLLLGPTGLVALNANQARTQATPGIRVGLLRGIDDCTTLEGNYLWAQPFQSYTQPPSAGGPYTINNLGGLTFSDVASAAMRTEAQFQGAEFNARYCNGGVFTWLTGFRWVQWNQTTTIGYSYTPSSEIGSVQSRVGNDLYGWQFGGIMRLWENGGRWQVTGLGKAGVYYNTAWQVTSAQDGRVPVPPNNPVRANGQQTSFVGELGMNSTYWFTDWMAWRLGYTFFWLTDVAVPQAQFPISNIGNQTADINTRGSVLVHGLNTGFEVCW